MEYSFEDSVRHVADQDVEGIVEARVLYGDSWRAEGGFSAFFNIKRKIDRFVNCCKRPLLEVGHHDKDRRYRIPYDVFSQILFELQDGGETVLDTVRDLRRYLMLVEAFLVQEGNTLPLQRDNLAALLKKTRSGDLPAGAEQASAMWGEQQPSPQLLEVLVPEPVPEEFAYAAAEPAPVQTDWPAAAEPAPVQTDWPAAAEPAPVQTDWPAAAEPALPTEHPVRREVFTHGYDPMIHGPDTHLHRSVPRTPTSRERRVAASGSDDVDF